MCGGYDISLVGLVGAAVAAFARAVRASSRCLSRTGPSGARKRQGLPSLDRGPDWRPRVLLAVVAQAHVQAGPVAHLPRRHGPGGAVEPPGLLPRGQGARGHQGPAPAAGHRGRHQPGGARKSTWACMRACPHAFSLRRPAPGVPASACTEASPSPTLLLVHVKCMQRKKKVYTGAGAEEFLVVTMEVGHAPRGGHLGTNGGH